MFFVLEKQNEGSVGRMRDTHKKTKDISGERIEIQRIPLEGAKNIRDFGGFPTKDGKYIKPHHLLRSCELCVTTERDRKVLMQEYDLKKVLDFRTAKEREEHPDPVMDGVVNLHMPVLDEKALGVTRESQDGDFLDQLAASVMSPGFDATRYMSDIYEKIILSDNAARQYGRMFDELLAQEEGATLWHCTAGKDRAGIASILVLSALDVPEAVVEADYFKVNDFLRDENEKLCRSVEDKMNNHRIHDGLMKMFIVHRAYIEKMFDTIKVHYGTMDGYLEKGLGLNRDKKEYLKQLCVS